MECQAFSVVGLAMHYIGALEPDIFLANLRRSDASNWSRRLSTSASGAGMWTAMDTSGSIDVLLA